MGIKQGSRWRTVFTEFAHHLPYTLVSTLIAMAGVWWFATQHLNGPDADSLLKESRSLFHLFHPLHVCLSAIASTSLIWRYTRRIPYSIVIGALATVVPCGLSDYFFPYLGGLIFQQPMDFHVCIIEHPMLFFPFLTLGIVGGFLAEERLTGSSVFSHAAHVFVSSGASLLYLISFGFTVWLHDVAYIFPAFATIVAAVWLPCCISDIVVPVVTADNRCAKAG